MFPVATTVANEVVLGHWPSSHFLPNQNCGLIVTNQTIYFVSSVDGSVLFSQGLATVMAYPNEKANVVALFPADSFAGNDAVLLIGTARVVGVGTASNCKGFSRSVGERVEFPNVKQWILSLQNAHDPERTLLADGGVLATFSLQGGVPVPVVVQFDPPATSSSSTIHVKNLGYGMPAPNETRLPHAIA